MENKGIWEVSKIVWKKYGFLGFYRGIWPSIMGVVPYVGIDFAACMINVQHISLTNTHTHKMTC